MHSTHGGDQRVPDRNPPEGQGPCNPSGNQGRHTSLDNPPSPRSTRLRREMSGGAEAGTWEALSAIQGTYVSPREASLWRQPKFASPGRGLSPVLRLQGMGRNVAMLGPHQCIQNTSFSSQWPNPCACLERAPDGLSLLPCHWDTSSAYGTHPPATSPTTPILFACLFPV